jgi:hypothetical protein
MGVLVRVVAVVGALVGMGLMVVGVVGMCVWGGGGGGQEGGG